MTEPDLLQGLSEIQAALVRRVAEFLRVPVNETINPTSDLVVPAFAEDFRNRLALYHALNDDQLNKKTFEFAFAGANRAAGRTATITYISTHAGCDVEVDGAPFSCKTEASKGISRRTITISKLMEARWIRDCSTPGEYCQYTLSRVVHHLSEYDRIVMLRAFKLKDRRFEYHLVEIPKQLLMRIGGLRPEDFAAPSKNNGSGAAVQLNGKRAFRLVLDGSVEKVTVSGLDVSLCTTHAKWIVPIGSPSNLG